MGKISEARWRFQCDSGATLYIMVASLVVLLGVSALAIDLVALYVARNEAQRAADAAALAGAKVFVDQGCTTGSGGCTAGGSQEAPARQRAIDIAAQNPVAGQAPSNSTLDVSFSYPNPEEPQITVTVHRDSAHANAVPTFFGKIFGVSSVNVSASATAEAFNPSGGSVSVAAACLRPFLVPNCDSAHPVLKSNPEANLNCGGTGKNNGATVACPKGVHGKCYPSYFFDPNNHGAIVNPGVYNPSNPTKGGTIGEPWQLNSNAAPSQWYLVDFTGSGSLTTFIETCAPSVIACSGSPNAEKVTNVSTTDQGINGLINASGDGLGNGQDSICSPTTTPACLTPAFPITGGANNPNPNLIGQTFYGTSNSIASVVVYNGYTVNPSGSTVTVIGYMQLFIQSAGQQGSAELINTVILNVGGCGTSGVSSTPIIGPAGSPIPIRLIRTQ